MCLVTREHLITVKIFLRRAAGGRQGQGHGEQLPRLAGCRTFPPGHVPSGRFPLPILLHENRSSARLWHNFCVSMVKECSKHQILLCYH